MPQIIDEDVDFSKMYDKKYSQEVLDAVDDVIKMYFDSLKEFWDYRFRCYEHTGKIDIDKQMDKIDLQVRKKYGMVPPYPTLGGFIKEHSAGSYNHFIFQIDQTNFNVCSLDDFQRVGNLEILYKYYVKSYHEHTIIDCAQGGCDYKLNLFIPKVIEEEEHNGNQ